MKAVCYTKPGIKVLEAPEPEITHPEDVKIKIAYASLCGTDGHIASGELDEKLKDKPMPMILGHECSGTVIGLGPEATAKGLKVGDRVIFFFNLFCGKCHYCRNGQEGYCLNIKLNTEGMAQFIVVREQQVFKLPDSVGLKEGCLAEPVSVSMRGIDLANIRPGRSVAIFGGGIGLLILQLAIRSGASPLVLVEPVASKRKLGLKFGADFTLDPRSQDVLAESLKITGNLGFDTVIEASGAFPAAKPAFDILGRGGTLVYFSMHMPQYDLPLNLFTLFYKEATIHGVFQSPYEFPRTMSILPKLNLKDVITATYPLDAAPEAFEAYKTGEHPKIVIQF